MRAAILGLSIFSCACGSPSTQSGEDAGRAASSAPRVLEGAPPGEVLELAANTRVNATLEAGDQALVDGSLSDDYGLYLEQGEAVTVVARGGQSGEERLDVQAFLLFNGQEVTSDDESAARDGNGNARIVFSPPIRGFYVLRVTTSGPGEHRGPYELEVFAGGRLRQL